MTARSVPKRILARQPRPAAAVGLRSRCATQARENLPHCPRAHRSARMRRRRAAVVRASWSLHGNAGNREPESTFSARRMRQPVVFKVNGQSRRADHSRARARYFSQRHFLLSRSSADGLNSFAMGDRQPGRAAQRPALPAVIRRIPASHQAGSYMWGEVRVTANRHSAATDGAKSSISCRAAAVSASTVHQRTAAWNFRIYPSAPDPYDYSSIFMGQKSGPGGILMSSGILDSDYRRSGTCLRYIRRNNADTQIRCRRLWSSRRRSSESDG